MSLQKPYKSIYESSNRDYIGWNKQKTVLLPYLKKWDKLFADSFEDEEDKLVSLSDSDAYYYRDTVKATQGIENMMSVDYNFYKIPDPRFSHLYIGDANGNVVIGTFEGLSQFRDLVFKESKDVYTEAKVAKSPIEIGSLRKSRGVLYIHKLGYDANGNWSYWVSKGANKPKKIQNQNLNSITDIYKFENPDKYTQETIDFLVDYWDNYME